MTTAIARDVDALELLTLTAHSLALRLGLSLLGRRPRSAANALLAAAFVRCRGLLEGQLPRSRLKSSLLGAVLLMACHLVLMELVGASEQLIAGLGWFVLTAFVLSDDLRAFADRAFCGAGSRAGRSLLRTIASSAGGPETLDLTSLSRGRSSDVVGYLSTLDRAALAAVRLEAPSPSASSCSHGRSSPRCAST